MVAGLVMSQAPPFSESDREAIYRVIGQRRDVREGYLAEPLPEELLHRILAAAHCAPSVGLMQPTRFLVIRSLAVRKAVHDAFLHANEQATQSYAGERREQYAALKLEGILESPQNLCILCDPNTERGHQLGRAQQPETAIYSTVCAIQNLWLAARAEGVGVGWVSILDPDALRSILKIPAHLVPVAYLCMGFVDEFATEPALETRRWERRIPLADVISYETCVEIDEA